MNSADIKTSWRLQLLDQILCDADGPLSVIDISERSRPFAGADPRLANPGQCINELRDNDGYEIAGGRAWGRFPDGKYKYWYVRAPGFYPRWYVTKDFKTVIVGAGGSQHEMAALVSAHPVLQASSVEAPAEDLVRICAYEPCGHPVPIERLSLMCVTCCDEHSRLWRESMRPKVEQGMLL